MDSDFPGSDVDLRRIVGMILDLGLGVDFESDTSLASDDASHLTTTDE